MLFEKDIEGYANLIFSNFELKILKHAKALANT